MWDPEFLKICESSSDKEIKKLPQVVKQTLAVLTSSPEEIHITYTSLEHFKELLQRDYVSGMFSYWKEIDERIKFLWQIMSLKGSALLRNIINCINSQNYFPALISTRALLENVAVFHHHLWKIIPTYNSIMKNGTLEKILRKEIKGLFVSSELENLLIKYSHGTKLKELIQMRKEWKQEGISKYIRFLSQNKNYTKTSEYYSFLCEVAHPNIGSNLVFHNKIYADKETIVHKFGKNQSVNFFLTASAYPLNICCEILGNGIKQLREVKFIR